MTISLLDTTVRDGNQSNWGATGLDTAMMLGIAPAIDRVGFEAIDFTTSTHMAVAVRYSKQDPWERLRLSLSEGVGAGEGIPELAARVEQVMGARIRSDARTIARTETIGSYNEGRLESWRQSGRVAGKVWIAALDERTRETHISAHDQTVGFDELFLVGDGAGPAPGSIGLAEEDINCRCAMATAAPPACTRRAARRRCRCCCTCTAAALPWAA